ncbi:hypothetical protein F5Y04DRAFT_287572 [Hypomontagnella monticulosa]|nr:hypothetical protein F5Y04DRAFT_287572 [Hypomontagnella monticulosa]
MVRLRDKIGKYAMAYPREDAPDLGVYADCPALQLDAGRHIQGDESSGNNSSLRHRFKQTLSMRKSCSALRSAEYGTAYDSAQRYQGSLIRKSINSLSSSLRRRFSSDETSSGEYQSRQTSMIRKSFGSMSSSLRGIRASMSSRSSQDRERRAATTRGRSFYEAAELMGNPGVHPDHLGFEFPRHVVTWDDWENCDDCDDYDDDDDCDDHSDLNDARDCIPQLPELDVMIPSGWTENVIPEDTSPNTLANMSIFDRLNNPLAKTWSDETTEEDDEATAIEPAPIMGRLPIRVKRSSTNATSVRVIRSEATDTSCPSVSSGLPNGDLKDVSESSRVPMEWLDTILETSVATRTDILRALASSCNEERVLQRQSKRVYVFVPDENDHGKPWPKRCYPDLKTAIADIYARFRPYYANFAAYTSAIRTVQLFPSDFKMPDNKAPIPGSVIFNIREALVNWDAPSRPHSLCDEDKEPEAVTIPETPVEAGAEPESNTSPVCSPLCGSEAEEVSNDGMLKPNNPISSKSMPMKNPNLTLLTSL